MCYRLDEDGEPHQRFLKCKLIKQRCWASMSLDESIRQILLLKKSAWEVAMAVVSLENLENFLVFRA